MFQFGLVPTTNKPARIMKDTISAIDHKITNSIINDEFKTAILTADISEYFPKIYAFKLKTILDIHRGNPSSTYAQSGGEGSSRIRTNAYKRGGGSNFGDFCAYVLCEWPPKTQFLYKRIINENLIKAFKSRLHEILWEIINSIKDLNESYKKFIAILTSVYSEVFPKNRINVRHSKN